MNRAFEAGREYGVLHIGDRTETVLITSRGAKTVTLGDGRKARILAGIAPDGGGEEVIRLGERGPVAFGGVVRACHIREARS